MVGESDVADLARGFLFRDPFPDAQRHKLLPLGEVGELVHQVVVDVAGLEPPELFVEIPVDGIPLLDQVLRQFGRNADLVADAVAGDDLPERGFAARVDVRRVVIVHASAEGGHDLLLRLFDVDGAAFPAETHAPVAQDGERVSVFIVPILHYETSARAMASL